MATIFECVDSFKKLLDIEYEFILGRKGKSVTLNIKFEKSHFFHLIGLQHLTDMAFALTGSREKLFDKIEKRYFDENIIKKSAFFSQIKSRIDEFVNLESIFDSNELIFTYNETQDSFSVIKADYLMQNISENTKTFTFLSQDSDKKYFCRSFFPMDKTDYSIGQTKWTLLFKKKIRKSTKTEEILYQHQRFIK